jgi:hypothetical protein
VVVQKRRDSERADLERLAVSQEPPRRNRQASSPECGLAKDPRRRLADVQRNISSHLSYEAPVILMGVGDDNAQQRRVIRGQAGDLGQRHVLVPSRVQGSPHVEYQARVRCLNLNAAAADLMSASVDAYSH